MRLVLLFAFLLFAAASLAKDSDLDRRVEKFLAQQRYSWRDMNVPQADGRLLHDLILKNNYTRALEIGTSTGHSSIWMAWALSKTGGVLITIEIDPRRHRQALENFARAGLESYVDARLGDAHELVKTLEGPFDFVFSDADKGWYVNYFLDIDPKLEVGGCFTAHNVSDLRGPNIERFLKALRSKKNYSTTIERTSRAGVSVSYKISQE